MNTNNFNDIYFDYIYNEGEDSLTISFPMIVFIHSGKLTIRYDYESITINKGEAVFLSSRSKICICKKDCGDEHFCATYIGFSQTILLELYSTINNKKQYQQTCADIKIVSLPCVPCIQSLYISIATYLEWGIKPSKYIVELKQQEGIFCLLLIDDKFYNFLFDFVKKKENIH